MGKKYTADTFEGAVTGTASGNVAKAGDTMTGDLSITSSSSGERKIVIGNTDGSQTTNDYSKIHLTGKSTSSSSTTGAEVVLNTGGSGLARVRFNTDYNYGSTDGHYNGYVGYSGGNNSVMYLQHGPATSAKNTISLGSTYTNFNKPLRIGGNASANELDDYEEGTFNQTFHILSMGGSASYDVSDFGNGSETSKYVKIGRLVMCTVYFQFSSRPAAWATSGNLQNLALGTPFTNADPVGHGSWGSFGYTTSLNSYNLHNYSYSGQNYLAFESTRSYSSGNFTPIYPYEFLSGVPAGNRQARISYSFYTND